MSFQDVSNPKSTARLTRRHQSERRSRSERLARTSQERPIRVRAVSQHSIRNYSEYEIQTDIAGFEGPCPKSVLVQPHGLGMEGTNTDPTSSPRSRVRPRHKSAPSLLSATVTSTFSSTGSQEDEGDTESLSKIRARIRQRSEFGQLVTDIRHFQTLVKDLEMTLQTQGIATSPEVAWRTRILWTSAVETESAVTQRLMEYERSLCIPENSCGLDSSNQEIRTAQSACLKLHRDVQRTHRILHVLLTKHRQTQEFDIQAQLGSVAWTTKQVEHHHPAHDEIQKLSKTMHEVNDLLQEIAGLVHLQQEPIDHLEDTMQHAHDTVKSGRRHLLCTRVMENPQHLMLCGEPSYDAQTATNEEETYHHRMELLLPSCGANHIVRTRTGPQGYDRNISLHDDEDDNYDMNEVEYLTCFAWKSHWERLRDGVSGWKDDLVLASQDLQRMASSSVSSTSERVPAADVNVHVSHTREL